MASDKSKAKHFVSGNRYEIGEGTLSRRSAAAKGQMIVAGLGGRRVCIGGSQSA